MQAVDVDLRVIAHHFAQRANLPVVHIRARQRGIAQRRHLEFAEIAHALREHSREQVSQAIAAQSAIGIGAALLGLGEGTADLANTAYGALIATRFSRVDESEADRIGLELTARAGYDPRAGVALWQKMMKAHPGGGSPEFLSSHPAESNRIQQIQALLPTVMPLYEQAHGRK